MSIFHYKVFGSDDEFSSWQRTTKNVSILQFQFFILGGSLDLQDIKDQKASYNTGIGVIYLLDEDIPL